MLVRLTTSRASLRTSHDEGSEIDLPAKEAQRLIDAGQAVPVRSQPVETTSRRAPQRRTTRAPDRTDE